LPSVTAEATTPFVRGSTREIVTFGNGFVSPGSRTPLAFTSSKALPKIDAAAKRPMFRPVDLVPLCTAIGLNCGVVRTKPALSTTWMV
jgi:hypothetical protein